MRRVLDSSLARSSRTPTSPWSATRSPTSSGTSSWGSTRRPTSTATRTPTTTTSRERRRPDGRVAIREGFIRSAYDEADESSALAAQLMGGSRRCSRAPTTASRPSGTRSTPGKVLERRRAADRPEQRRRTAARRPADEPREGVLGRRHRADLPQPGRPRSGRSAIVPGRGDYEALRDQIVAAFQGLTDPANPGSRSSKSLQEGGAAQRRRHRLAASEPQRRRVVVLRPPYQFDAATPASGSRSRSSSGSTGTCRTWSTWSTTSTCTRPSSPADRDPQGGRVAGVRAIDVAPTIAFLLGIPGPQNARGQILYDIVRRRRTG